MGWPFGKTERRNAPVTYIAFIKECIRTGSIASIAIMPVGYVFKSLGLRIGHYGPKFAEALFGSTAQPLLLIQHLVIGWFSAAPFLLALLLIGQKKRITFTLLGGLYGAAYYVLVNSLALPIIFADPTPWQLGFSFIYPSLIGHIAFGVCLGLTVRKAISRDQA